MRAIGMRPLLTFYLVMAAVAVAALVAAGSPRSILPGWDSPFPWVWNLGLGLGVGLGMVLSSRIASAHFSWAASLTEEFRSLLGNMGHREVLVAAVLSGVSEELLFRGVLQPALGLWIAAAVFGVLHIGPNRRFLPWTAMAFGAGVVFGGMFAWTGNLMAPIIAHFVINYLNLRHMTLAETGPEVQMAGC